MSQPKAFRFEFVIPGPNPEDPDSDLLIDYEFDIEGLPESDEELEILEGRIGRFVPLMEKKYQTVHDVSFSVDKYFFGFTTYELEAEERARALMEEWKAFFECIGFRTSQIRTEYPDQEEGQ